MRRALAPAAGRARPCRRSPDWGRAFAAVSRAPRRRHAGRCRPDLFERAEALYASLVATQAKPVVLHGDLHHWNILRAVREPWLAIDPHGVIGEPAFEVGPWMRNPVGDPGDADESASSAEPAGRRGILDRRLDIFSEELDIDARSGFATGASPSAMLSACWSDESGHVGRLGAGASPSPSIWRDL